MRLLIDQLADLNEEHIRSALELQKEHEIVYWIRIESVVPLDKSLFPKTVFHEYLDAVNNIPAPGVDVSTFEPWSSEDIQSFATWESEIMSMMDKGQSTWPVDKRKDFYYQLLRYWKGVLDTYKPDAIVFNAPPHQVFNFALYAIAQARGLRTVVFDITFRPDRLIAYQDYRTGNDSLAKAKKDGFGEAPVAIDDLPSYIRDHYKTVSGTPDPTPAALVEFKRTMVPARIFWRRMQSIVPYIKDGTIFERGVRRATRLFKPRLEDIYRSLSKPADLSLPYVYVPLHYQPECTTSPQGGIYVGQTHLVRTVAAALPSGWQVYVKEHPAQWPSHWGDFTPQRYEGFYEEIAKIPNVRIVPITTSTFELCDHARATATVTGTAGWESVMRGKCALIFGFPWFMHAPGVLRVSSFQECKDAIARIEAGERPQKEVVLKYLHALSEVIFPGTLSLVSGEVVGSSPEEQWQKMYEAIKQGIGA